MSKHNCLTCKYFADITLQGINVRICRRLPPSPKDGFPKVDQHTICGEHPHFGEDVKEDTDIKLKELLLEAGEVIKEGEAITDEQREIAMDLLALKAQQEAEQKRKEELAQEIDRKAATDFAIQERQKRKQEADDLARRTGIPTLAEGNVYTSPLI